MNKLRRRRDDASRPTVARRRTKVRSTVVMAAAALLGSVVVVADPSDATASCPVSLATSSFEIDTNANAAAAAGCLDWFDASTADDYLTGVQHSTETTQGNADNSFGKGASENDSNPSVVTGSIPPNKSDLKTFGVYAEAATPKVLTLFWVRVQNPSGTTNMDFELNQKRCNLALVPTNCSTNQVTPVRTVGDKLITYELSKGGTFPIISIRTWGGSSWSAATVLSGGANATAIGSVNTSTIAASASPFGSVDAYTFGEAAISYQALFGGNADCQSLGSAYLKSRSSDSFSSELKDFIAPERVTVTNCSAISTTATETATVGQGITDTAHLENVTGNAGGTITFRVFDDELCTNQVGTSSKSVNGPGNYTSDAYITASAVPHYWIADYSGDPNNDDATGACGDDDETTEINPASPGISTTPNPSSAILGDALGDSANLSGGYNPTGTITFRLYPPSDASCSGTAVYSEAVAVSGAGTYPTVGSYAAAAIGTYRWVASYGGDGNNNAAAGGCQDELVTIDKAASSTSTALSLYPQDSATVGASQGGTPTGSVTFDLYGPDDADCSEDPVYSETVQLDGNGSAATSNTEFAVDADNEGHYEWVATYGGDGTHHGSIRDCGDEHFEVTVDEDNA